MVKDTRDCGAEVSRWDEKTATQLPVDTWETFEHLCRPVNSNVHDYDASMFFFFPEFRVATLLSFTST